MRLAPILHHVVARIWIAARRSSSPVLLKIAQNETAMLVLATVKTMPIDCHAPLIIITLSSGVSSFNLSMWRPPAVVAIATIAGKVWGYS
ncbi:hypothetical protein Y032_0362g3500 [Ancylostoma ceylanicum]|uniref:Uncharacterized protein n=1 Tax=Ancylostoma ceylanicum TaxID=53326 RepID=A0A016RW16_9BILA|nr:hypothetical protein Y032_0362g3500 [Ancylostoma ceylanicum]